MSSSITTCSGEHDVSEPYTKIVKATIPSINRSRKRANEANNREPETEKRNFFFCLF